MKLVRYGIKNRELPGIIDGEGKIRSLAGFADEESEYFLSDSNIDALCRLNLSKLPVVPGEPQYGCPIVKVGKFVAIGLNYTDHAKETNSPVPDEPLNL